MPTHTEVYRVNIGLPSAALRLVTRCLPWLPDSEDIAESASHTPIQRWLREIQRRNKVLDFLLRPTMAQQDQVKLNDIASQDAATSRIASDIVQCEGSTGMGNKQSIPGELVVTQSPVIAEIQATYSEGESDKAQDLVKAACEENLPRPEKLQLLRIAAAYGDVPSVRYLIHEAKVVLPTDPSDDNPVVMAAHYGHGEAVILLLDSLPDACSHKPLLNWLLVSCCEQGHLSLVKLLILTYHADPDCYATRNNEFPVLRKLPLYATCMTGNV
ncbi:unnamed protein product [Ranitomeya imitator]|uniref:Uncharacterized protein n=1 Tax=Ranitomeya imitator TaxID=111125 RepID=A0ABN9MC81_9NEOB|nr:unnamed protein product [Ranitomeya imitator]